MKEPENTEMWRAGLLLWAILVPLSLSALEPAMVLAPDSSSSSARGLAIDIGGNMYCCGTFSNTVDFDPGPNVANLTAASSYQAFIAKYLPDGQLIWAKQITGINGAGPGPASLCIDNSGAIIIVGQFSGTVDFDPGAGIANLSAAHLDSFALKLDSDGAFVWAKAFLGDGTSGSGGASTVAVDENSNVYIGGSFEIPTDFDPEVGTNIKIPTGRDGYLLKLDSAGNLLWVNTLTGSMAEIVTNLKVRNGFVYSVGEFSSPVVDFDPGAGITNLSNAGAGTSDGFIWKLDTSGNFVYAKLIGSSQDAIAYAIALDANDHLVVTGCFNGTVDLDPGPGTFSATSTYNSGFVLRLDNSGNFEWARQFKAAGHTGIFSVTLDSQGFIYGGGGGKGTIEILPGGSTFEAAQILGQAYLVKLDSTGSYVDSGAFDSTTSMGGSGISSFALNPNGDVYMCGEFTGNVDFDPRQSVLFHNTTSGSLFICIYRQTSRIDLNGNASGSGYSATFNQRGPVPIVDRTQLSIEGNGFASLSSAAVVITNAQNGANEILTADPGNTGIAVSYSSATSTLQLNGSSSIANYQQVLRTVAYNNLALPSQVNTDQRAVKFTLNNGISTSDWATAAVTIVRDQSPTASASASPTVLDTGDATLFTATASDPENDALTYRWDFGDGSPYSTEQNPAHTYTAPGDYTATVSVTDAIGAVTTASVTIHVGRAPTTRFTTSGIVGFVGQPLLFDGSYSTDPENAIVQFSWNFGDGTPQGSLQQISHIYTAVGAYQVTLTVTDAEGLASSVSRQIEVLPADELGLFHSYIKYRVKWDRNKTNGDTLWFDANVNVGADTFVGMDSPVAIEVATKRYEGVLDGKLRAKNGNETWQVFANLTKQSPGETRIRFTARKTSLGLNFNQAGAVQAGDADNLSLAVPVRIELAGRVFDIQIDSDFNFSKAGTKANGDGTGP